MAVRKYVSIEKLSYYDEQIKNYISDSDAALLTSANEYADSVVQDCTTEDIEALFADEEGTGGYIPTSSYSYGTEDLVDGESALETGKLYFVYEEE